MLLYLLIAPFAPTILSAWKRIYQCSDHSAGDPVLLKRVECQLGRRGAWELGCGDYYVTNFNFTLQLAIEVNVSFVAF
jgi:hypothetical protein